MQQHNQQELPKLKDGEFVPYPLAPNVGFILGKLPEQFVPELKNIKTGQHFEQSLVGHLEKEFEVHFSDELSKFLIMKSYDLEQQIGYGHRTLNGVVNLDTLPEPRITSSWINYQKKHDFNPPHNHTGLYSFVIWHKIPYNLEDEMNTYPNLRKGECRSSLFCFLNGNVETALHLDKCHENYMAVFPSHLMHYVAPFYTSDDYRISFSGNISFET